MDEPLTFVAVTVNDCVLVILVVTTGPDRPVRPNPVHVKVDELPLTEQDATKFTLPPPIGNAAGVGVIEHPPGGGGATGTTMDAGTDCPVELWATTLKVDVSLMFVVIGFDVFPEMPGPVHTKVVGAPVEHAAVNETAPPEAGNEVGEATIEQPLGAGRVLTRTVTDAGGAAPLAFFPMTVYVEVWVMPWTTSDAGPSPPVVVDTPGPLHSNDVATPPPEQLGVNVADPPPKGSEDGDAATVQ